MAITIPRYDESRVKTVPMEIGGRAQGMTAAAFGSAIGEGLQQVSKEMEKSIAEENKRTAYNHAVELDGLETRLRFGDPDTQADGTPTDSPSEGFLNIKGSEAKQYKDTYLVDFKEKAASLIPKDVNPALREQLMRINESRFNALTADFSRHTMTQEEMANQAAAGAMQASILRNIGNYAFDDNRFSQEIEKLKHVIESDVIKDMGEDNPEASAVLESRLGKDISDAYSRRMDRLLLANPGKAKEFLEKNIDNGTFDADAVKKYLGALGPAVAFENGLGTANRLIDTYPNETVGQLLDRLRKDPGVVNDKEAFMLAESQIKTIKAAQEQGRRQEVDALVSEVTAPLAKKIANRQLPTLDDLKDDPNAAKLLLKDPTKYKELAEHIIAASDRDLARRQAISDRADRKQEHEARQALLDEERRTKKVQRSNYSDLWSSPDALLQTDLNTLVLQEKLSPEQAQHLEARKKSMNKDTLGTEIQEINTILGAAKIKPKTENYDMAIEYIMQRKAAYKADPRNNKNDPPASEVKLMAREAVAKSVTGWFDGVSDKPAYKMKISDVPAGEQVKIREALKKKNKPVTDSEIISLYMKKSMGVK